MSGWFLGLINRAPVSTPVLEVGTAVSGYPITMVADPTIHNQWNITPSGGVVRWRYDIGSAPSTAGDADYAVNYAGLFNHNLDGCTWDIYYGTTNVFASATFYVSQTLTNYSAFADAMVSFTSTGKRYWWFQLSSGLPGTVKIGHAPFGWGIDVGYPVRPSRMSPTPQGGIVTTQRGYGIPTRIDRPNYSTQVTFRNGNYIKSTTMSDYSKSGSGNYVLYNLIERCFDEDYQVSLASAALTRTGLCAGSGVPMPYHRGDAQGISDAGRPARFGRMTADLGLFTASNFSQLALTIDDVLPRGRMVKPTT